ncbi:zinc finger protein 236 isoform X2 [Bradysia coprophila]|uniref:zinc finger protein 236 isoform X2 n=1 Tax=Bradysia coprophila TaxID=38358 RepID=UPI00187DB75F|nr:zinc finger protein 236 isoform X2 [Bradysia coprophila]
MDQFQKVVNGNGNGNETTSIDLSRLNQFALRDTDGTYQFITMPPRSIEQEYIDHSLLTPDYLGDNIQNALVVDLLQTSNGNTAFQQQHPSDRQFLTENELVGEVQIHHDLNEANDNRVKQALLQYINKSYQNPPQIITAEHLVNVKIEPEMPPLAPIRNLYSYPRGQQQAQSVLTNHVQKPEDDGRNLKQFDYDDSECNESIQSRLATKKNLPHKKRIVTKLKIINKKGADNKTLTNGRDTAGATKYTCELCGFQTSEQLNFFSHLKLHYEPSSTNVEQPIIENAIVQRDDISLPVLKIENLNNEITEHDSSTIDDDVDNDEFESSVEFPTSNMLNSNEKSTLIDHANDEFSDTEDMLEGIRSVVDKVQQSVENDLIAIGNNTKDWFDNHGNLSSTFDAESQDNIDRKHTSDLYGNISAIEGIANDPVVYDESLAQNNILRTELDKPSKEAIDVKPTLTLREMRENYVEEREENDMESKKSKGRKKIYVCKVCEKVCNSRNALHYHFLSHSGERPHVCEQCGKRFYSISALKVHRRVHTLEKPFSCDHCGRAFRQWGDLSYHITSIHTEEKSHTCEFCGKGFARRYSLVIHRRIHTNERNYKCDFCTKSFRASSYLQDHRKIHTGEKNHKCTTCGKLFRVRGDLKRHLKIHLRLIEKEQTQKLKDEAEIVDSLVVYNDNNAAADYTCNKQISKDTVKTNIIYGDATNGDIFNDTTAVSNEVAGTASNNNIESNNFRSPRKRKAKSTPKQKKTKIQESLQDNFSVFQLPASIQNSGSIVASMPVGINKILAKPDRTDGVAVSVADEQYQIFLLEA